MENNNTKKNKYLSNCPFSSIDSYGEGVNAITEMVSNKDVFNIGVVAPYGAGKSSLIKTYKDNNATLSKKKKKRILEVSLLHLSEQQNDKPKKEQTEKSKNEDALIEKSILEQLFFKEVKRKLPFSKIDRIHNRVLTSLLLSLLIVVSILSSLFAVMEYNKEFPWSDGSRLILMIGIASFFVFATITAFIISLRISKISFQNIELEFNKIENGSVLNLFLDEIVYYFKKTKTEVVVFEDIERFGSISLFTKLREMNHVLNNNKRINRKITFIYCVTDDFFTNEKDRAKFFEFVISLVPVLNPKNVNQQISDSLEANGFKLDPVFIKKVSHFITDKRVLNDIINDFVFFKSTLVMSDLNNEKLFSMMVYKNLCFKDYVKLLEEDGILFNLFNSQKLKLIDDVSRSSRRDLENIQKSIDDVRGSNFVLNRIDDLKNLVAGIIAIEGDVSPRMPSDYVDIATAKTFNDITTGLFIQIDASIPSRQYYNQQVRGLTFKYLSIDTLNDRLGKPLSELEEMIVNNQINRLLEQKRVLINDLSTINGSKLQQLLENPEAVEGIKEELTDYPFLLFAIKNGYIDESYYMYIGQYDSKMDNSFIYSVMADVSTDPANELKNRELIIEELDKSEFGNKYIFNYSLIETLFKNNTNSDKQKVFLSYLSSRNDDTKQFIKNYYLSNHNFENLFISICKSNKYAVFDLFTDSDIAENDKINLIRLLINHQRDVDISELNVERIITNTIENSRHPLENMISIFDKAAQMIDFFGKIGIQGLDYVDYDGSDNKNLKDFFETVITNKLFSINYFNIQTIELFFLNAKEINVSILFSNKDSLADYFKTAINDVVFWIAENNKVLHEDKTIVEEILVDNKITNRTKVTFIKSLADSISYLDALEIDIYSALLKENKLAKKWVDVAKIYHVSDELKKEVYDFVKKNIDAFDDQITDKELFLFIIEQSSSNKEDYTLVESIANNTPLKVDSSDIKNDELCSILIKKGVIESNESNLLSCNDKLKSLALMLNKNKELEVSFGGITFTANSLIAILQSDEISDNCKKAALKANLDTIRDNASDTKLSELISSLIIKTNDLFLDVEITIQIVISLRNNKADNLEPLIDICLNHYEDEDLVRFIGMVNNEIIQKLKPEDGKEEVVIETSLFDSDKYIKALLDKHIINKVKKGRINTRINVSTLRNLAG